MTYVECVVDKPNVGFGGYTADGQCCVEGYITPIVIVGVDWFLQGLLAVKGS
jgi:hypothetical protein